MLADLATAVLAFGLAIGLATGLAMPSAFAFNLSDHKAVMLQAIDEVNACTPGTIDYLTAQALWIADLDEDINLIRKGLLFSHYYNPEKPLSDLVRFDSSFRVKLLADQIAVDTLVAAPVTSAFAVISLGHLLHHIQDMAAPPHVVPVAHGMNDSFEGQFVVRGDISSGLSCVAIATAARARSYEQIHRETAQETLSRVRSTPVPVVVRREGQADRRGRVATTAFWQPSSTETFGTYGVFGNHFGESDIVVGSRSFSIPESYFESFKRSQLRLAVRSTVQALSVYYFSETYFSTKPRAAPLL